MPSTVAESRFLVLVRIIDNCVQNAFKYGDEGPRR
jgi:hypothetical protein